MQHQYESFYNWDFSPINKKKRYFHSCLNTDSYDKRSFERLHEMSPRLQQIEEDGEELFPGFMNLLGDQWASLYKADPQIDPEASEKALAHKPLVQRVMGSEEYEKLRNTTSLDDFASAIGALSLGENTIEYIRLKQEQDQQLKEQMDQLKELQQQMKQNQFAMDKRDLQNKPPTKQQEQKQQSLEQQIQQLQQQVSQQLADGMNAEQMLQQAAQDAKDAQDGLQDLLEGPQPGSGKGEMEKVPLRTQLELAHQLKRVPQIKKVAEWAGRFKAIARRKQRSKVVDSVERQGVTQGDNPELLLPTELAQLKNQATRLDFLRRFAEKQTLQYATRGKDSTGKGPIVLCLDQSGSMTSRKEQAAGFTLAIAMIARAQKRDFYYIPFDSDIGEVLSFPKGKLTPNAIVKIATEFMDGGTNFKKPLDAAIKKIEASERFKNADILFVTDGEDSLSADFIAHYNRKKRELKFQCMTCVIGNLRPHTEADLMRFSDEIFEAGTLLETAENSGVFEI
jgi:uncharacterized protein with von Willebrand factor type A (vWA) domain